MKKDSKAYLITYTLLITIISGSLLAMASKGLESYKDANKKLELQKSIVNTFMELPKSKEKIVEVYNKRVKNYVVNAQGEVIKGMKASKVKVGEEYSAKRETPRRRNLPVYEIYGEDGKGEVLYYVFPLYGFGLWDVIWGYIALDAKDLNTIKGVVLAQKGETPGLGARISDQEIHDRYTGKKIYDDKGQLQRVVMQRGEHQGKSIQHYKGQEHKVDGMSGATITGNGVNAMFKEYLKLYDGFIQKKNKK
ncbi:NADH:ubiquinone reductase (Na(+)-transporting) subunit C [Microscilla marina]|uniref:Na(+)-translocating NADH-quinone reductase subunit C n=1 Tax=Microscilla marina ATCC 23134 TaxID=313606 RepID=A1ZH16_MICM2|nr:NADH:ubiquinone reductase (Na(+)-transporting) subunit C [Microscilla marina]EAY30285.1 na+-translocating NADH-quinone reductase subunit c [Microscilla marina ATCC 23134]